MNSDPAAPTDVPVDDPGTGSGGAVRRFCACARVALPYVRAAGYVAAIPLLILLVRALDARGMPDLQRWHRYVPADRFTASVAADGFTFDDYLRLEASQFAELESAVYGPEGSAGHHPFSRYSRGGLCDPAGYDRDWNRSYEHRPPEARGGVLLLHGLSDSPYSMRSVAGVYEGAGYYVLCPRLPGHGTVPAALLGVRWEDWRAAVRVAATRVERAVGPGKPLHVVGYSNGGTLALQHVLDAVEGSGHRVPDKVLLLSPAVGVTRFASLANWHKTLSFIPYFEKFKWESVVLEFDPFKYNSFPKNAGDQIHLLAKEVQGQIRRVAGGGRMAGVPPVLTFLSVVDSTVASPDVAEKLYRHLPDNGSELVIFDVNRCAQLAGFIRGEGRTFLDGLQGEAVLTYTLTIVTNRSAHDLEAVARTRPAHAGFRPPLEIGTAWPLQVYSLSHVAIPFPPDDPLYGRGPGDPGKLLIGALEPRGERDLLNISAEQLLRLRHNPFFGYLRDRVAGWIDDP